jgi:hypothetical protein
VCGLAAARHVGGCAGEVRTPRRTHRTRGAPSPGLAGVRPQRPAWLVRGRWTSDPNPASRVG